jgi:flagella basal body P-ring formation protein FlgA
MRKLLNVIAVIPLLISSYAFAVTAEPKRPDTSGFADATKVAALASQVQEQLNAVAPAGLRVDQVELGCKPTIGATLVPIAPGSVQFFSRAFMVELKDTERTYYCSASMDASREVLAASRDIQANEPIAQADFRSSWVDAFNGSNAALSQFPAHGPYVSSTPLRAGQPLYQNALVRPIVVHPGDPVMVMVKNGPVTLRAQLIAQSQASIGDSLTAVNPAGGTPVMVTVTGPRNAELVLQ